MNSFMWGLFLSKYGKQNMIISWMQQIFLSQQMGVVVGIFKVVASSTRYAGPFIFQTPPAMSE